MTDITAPNWHLVTKSEGGVVSLIRNIPLAMAVQLQEKLDPWYGMRGRGGRVTTKNDLNFREILGPEGWDGCTKAMQHALERPSEDGKEYPRMICKLCGAVIRDQVNP